MTILKIPTTVLASFITTVVAGMLIFVGNKLINAVDAAEVQTLVESEVAVFEAKLDGIQSRVERMDGRLQKIDLQMQDQKIILLQLAQTAKRQTYDGAYESNELIDLSLLHKHEERDRGILTVFLGLDPVSQRWCAAFINAVERQNGRHGTGSLLARSYLNYGKDTLDPKKGDIVVLWRIDRDSKFGHVGYLIRKTDTHVFIYGGNQDNMVSVKAYPLERVLGYRRP